MSTFSPNNSYCSARVTFVLTLLTLVIPCIALAGELNAPAAPNDAGSAMFSIEAIYQRLLNGSTGDKRGGTPGTFKEPAGAPAGTSHTLNDVMGVAPVKDTVDGASPDQVLTGKKFWGLKDGAGWGAQIGQMANHGAMEFTPGAATQTIPQGYYDGNGKVRGDANLVTGNIKAGTTIFGVTGKTEVVDTTSGDATAEEILSGKKAWVGGVEVTGTREPDAFPFSGTRWSNTGLDANGRWCDNGDGTVTDLFGYNGYGKGLVWLKNAGWCGAYLFWSNTLSHVAAAERAGVLANGSPVGLSDGSEIGQWRLPTAQECLALTNGTHGIRVGTPGPFDNVPSHAWSSLLVSSVPYANAIDLTTGILQAFPPDAYRSVWPVRNRK